MVLNHERGVQLPYGLRGWWSESRNRVRFPACTERGGQRLVPRSRHRPSCCGGGTVDPLDFQSSANALAGSNPVRSPMVLYYMGEHSSLSRKRAGFESRQDRHLGVALDWEPVTTNHGGQVRFLACPPFLGTARKPFPGRTPAP